MRIGLLLSAQDRCYCLAEALLKRRTFCFCQFCNENDGNRESHAYPYKFDSLFHHQQFGVLVHKLGAGSTDNQHLRSHGKNGSRYEGKNLRVHENHLLPCFWFTSRM